jgi:quercetin dioxygenase-like cupin family protein
MSCNTIELEHKNLKIGTDFTGAGLHVKLTELKKGMKLVQHKHTYDHLSLLLSGRVIVHLDTDAIVIDASATPRSMVIEAGRIHRVTAITDACWLCVHHDSEPVLQYPQAQQNESNAVSV